MFAETDGEIAIEADPPKALRSDKPIRLEFKNESEDKIDMFWHNFGGSKIQYKTIEPGDTRAQWTYVTHPWSAVSQSDPEAQIYVDAKEVFVGKVDDDEHTIAITK